MRGGPPRGSLPRLDAPGQASLCYLGLDGKRRTTRLLFDPAPTTLSTKAASIVSISNRMATHRFSSPQVATGRATSSRPSFRRGLLAIHRERQRENRCCTTIVTSNHIFNEVLCRSMADLHMLITNTPQGPIPMLAFPGIRPRSVATG